MVFVVHGSIVQLIVYVIRPMASGTGVSILPFGDTLDPQILHVWSTTAPHYTFCLSIFMCYYPLV